MPQTVSSVGLHLGKRRIPDGNYMSKLTIETLEQIEKYVQS